MVVQNNGDAKPPSPTLLKKLSLPKLVTSSHAADDSGQRGKRTGSKRTSLFHRSSGSSDGQDKEVLSPLQGEKPRTLQKTGRPLFGSLGRKATTSSTDRSDGDTIPSSPAYGAHEARSGFHTRGNSVLHHGEVQTTSGMFRKRKEYLVLTDTHLLRFKSLSRAAEIFPSITPSYGRMTPRHGSTNSVTSVDVQSLTSRSSAENENAVLLQQIIAAYKVDDGRPFFTTEVVYVDDEAGIAGSFQLMLHDPREADLWHTSIRGAAQKARLIVGQPYPKRLIDYLVHVLEAVDDYDQEYFKMFRVVRRIPSKSGGRSSTEDLSKLGSSVFYMVIGINRLHLISLPDFSANSGRFVDAKANKSSYGLVSLTTMEVQHSDDAFELSFRNPVQPMIFLELAASAAPEIATLIFRSILFLKPQWLDYTFLFSGPPGVLDESEAILPDAEENGCFDRTLVAYCSAYHCNVRNIRYAIDLEAEDSPEFRLFPPANTAIYSVLELLAIFRSLRYNESFRSISFNGTNLENLHALVDIYGNDHIARSSRPGPLQKKLTSSIPDGRSLLFQEVQALALKTNRVRRLDFGNTLPKRRPRDMFEEEGAVKDPGCEIAAALMPLCRERLTNVDWIIFSGIELGESDLEEFVPALNERQCRFRCLELSRCGLTDRGMQLFLKHLEKQHGTIESINIADNPGHLNLTTFPVLMSRFSQIRRLDLSRATSASGDSALISSEVMLAWRLEALVLTGIPINDQTLEVIAVYLNSEASTSLQYLEMCQCNLDGSQVARLMRSMTIEPGKARNMHLHVSANNLAKEGLELVKAIEGNMTPSRLSMRMVEYHTEARFRQLLLAMQKNSTILSLDIAQASLPYDAGEETCHALFDMFEHNSTLQELNMSGENAHLEIARFGIGLSYALNGLKKNKALQVLHIEYQGLGLEGTSALASVLETNSALREIHCSHNGINLQGFTVLVNSLTRNFNVVMIPLMLEDQAEAVRRMKDAISESRTSASVKHDTGSALKHSMRKTLLAFGSHTKENPLPTPQDIDQAVALVNSRWAAQNERLLQFLERNRAIARGDATPDSFTLLRPLSVASDGDIMELVMGNTTPRSERQDPLDITMETRMQALGVVDGNASERREGSAGGGVAANGRVRSDSQLTAKKVKVFDLQDTESVDDKDG